jgi:Ran GTPase-activating protein (RanGAP) involved in mRNA processing and transport
MAEALKSNSTLQKLELRSNNIGVEGATTLADALAINSKLQVLCLDCNNIGHGGTMAIVKALPTNNVALNDLRLISNDVSQALREGQLQTLLYQENRDKQRLELDTSKLLGKDLEPSKQTKSNPLNTKPDSGAGSGLLC